MQLARSLSTCIIEYLVSTSLLPTSHPISEVIHSVPLISVGLLAEGTKECSELQRNCGRLMGITRLYHGQGSARLISGYGTRHLNALDPHEYFSLKNLGLRIDMTSPYSNPMYAKSRIENHMLNLFWEAFKYSPERFVRYESDSVQACLCVMGLDGAPLQTGGSVDVRGPVIVGLKEPLQRSGLAETPSFPKECFNSSAEEIFLYSLSGLTLPIGVHYGGSNAERMQETFQFVDYVHSFVQMCEACRTTNVPCKKECGLQACELCISLGQQCRQMYIVAAVSDAQTDMKTFLYRRFGRMVVLDAPHCGKSWRASFRNYIIESHSGDLFGIVSFRALAESQEDFLKKAGLRLSDIVIRDKHDTASLKRLVSKAVVDAIPDRFIDTVLFPPLHLTSSNANPKAFAIQFRMVGFDPISARFAVFERCSRGYRFHILSNNTEPSVARRGVIHLPGKLGSTRPSIIIYRTLQISKTQRCRIILLALGNQILLEILPASAPGQRASRLSASTVFVRIPTAEPFLSDVSIFELEWAIGFAAVTKRGEQIVFQVPNKTFSDELKTMAGHVLQLSVSVQMTKIDVGDRPVALGISHENSRQLFWYLTENSFCLVEDGELVSYPLRESLSSDADVKVIFSNSSTERQFAIVRGAQVVVYEIASGGIERVIEYQAKKRIDSAIFACRSVVIASGFQVILLTDLKRAVTYPFECMREYLSACGLDGRKRTSTIDEARSAAEKMATCLDECLNRTKLRIQSDHVDGSKMSWASTTTENITLASDGYNAIAEFMQTNANNIKGAPLFDASIINTLPIESSFGISHSGSANTTLPSQLIYDLAQRPVGHQKCIQDQCDMALVVPRKKKYYSDPKFKLMLPTHVVEKIEKERIEERQEMRRKRKYQLKTVQAKAKNKDDLKALWSYAQRWLRGDPQARIRSFQRSQCGTAPVAVRQAAYKESYEALMETLGTDLDDDLLSDEVLRALDGDLAVSDCSFFIMPTIGDVVAILPDEANYESEYWLGYVTKMAQGRGGGVYVRWFDRLERDALGVHFQWAESLNEDFVSQDALLAVLSQRSSCQPPTSVDTEKPSLVIAISCLIEEDLFLKSAESRQRIDEEQVVQELEKQQVQEEMANRQSSANRSKSAYLATAVVRSYASSEPSDGSVRRSDRKCTKVRVLDL